MAPVQAVRTTGIYCRPSCSAKPHARNVERFELAASAEAAGYRACLRCRPYRAPQSVGWTAPALVCRAVNLILDGALDHGTEATLGARLGVSARHLRRFFTNHLGVTPDQLARSRRAHFARRLLDDTDLSIGEIAFAAGFGSVRQFNRVAQEVFRASPLELRARRRRADRLVADGGLALRLWFRGELDWSLLASYFTSRAIPGVESVTDGVYRRTVAVEGDPGAIELLAGGDDHLILRAHLPHWEGLIHVVERVRRIANLDADTEEANRVLADDPTLGPLLMKRPGLRVAGTWDPFETGVRAIIGQQVSVAGATTIAGRLVRACGTPVPGLEAFGLTHTFPTAEHLTTATLDGLGLPQARINAIRGFAASVASGEVLLDRSASLEHLTAQIVALPGLGPWTANYIALRLGERDAFPVTDLGLRNAYARLAPDPAVPLSKASERWQPWRSLAAVHLWMSL